jgi:hypothetical protein
VVAQSAAAILEPRQRFHVESARIDDGAGAVRGSDEPGAATCKKARGMPADRPEYERLSA